MSGPLEVVFKVGVTDVSTVGCILSWDGIMSECSIKGDLIELDWVDGATFEEGPISTCSFDVPLLLEGPTLAESFASLETVKGWRGTELTLTREYYTGVTLVSETCTAVLVSELSPIIKAARFIKLVLVFQNLSGGWSGGGS